MRFEKNSCVCGSSKSAVVFTARDFNFGNVAEHARILRCGRCGSLYPELFPAREEIEGAYSSYYTGSRARGAVRESLRRLLGLFRRSHLLRLVPISARRVLDYGCGSGEYLSEVARFRPGAERYGCDITRPNIVDEAFFWIPMPQLEERSGAFDWITLSHVLEHVPDPREVLESVRSLLSVNGGVWISTPSADSFLIRAFGRFARDVDFPRHRAVYSRQCLEELLAAAGLVAEFKRGPRIDGVMNFITCARNVLRSGEASKMEALGLLIRSSVMLIAYLLPGSHWLGIGAPELVVVARPTMGQV